MTYYKRVASPYFSDIDPMLADEEITQFYNRDNIASVIGNKEFVKWLCETKIPKLKENTLVKTLLSKPFSVKQITQLVADY